MSEKASIISKNGSVSRFAGPGYRNVKIIAVVAGLIGFLLACLSPLMPVNQTTAQLNWPQDNQVVNVAAPLVSFVPIDMRVSVPCATAAELPVPWRRPALDAAGRWTGRDVSRPVHPRHLRQHHRHRP